MREQIGLVDRWVNQGVEHGDFASREECVAAMLNWLVLNDYVNPSRLCQSEEDEEGNTLPLRFLRGMNEAEETRLEYEILRDRDA